MAHGSLWDNLPSSDNITQFDLTNIILDETLMNSVLDYDYIVIQVTDIDGNWWRAQVNFDNGPKIINIDVKAKDKPEDSRTDDFDIDSTTTIDFLSTSWFPNSCYQNANIGPINTLHVEISEVAPKGKAGMALKYFMLIIDGSC